MARKRKGLSQRAYAKFAGISLAMVQKDIEHGRVVFYEDGSINPEASIELRRKMVDELQRRDRRRAETGNAASLGGDRPDTSSVQGLRRILMGLEAQIKQLDLKQKRGELVEKAKAAAAFFEAARRIRDTWLAWPARVAARMAADLGVADVHLVQRVLDRYVHEHLEDLADPEPRF